MESSFYDGVMAAEHEQDVDDQCVDNPDPQHARAMLDRANLVGATVDANVSWSVVAFLLALGATTSLGTLAMGLSKGLTPYLVEMVAMLVWTAVLIVFFAYYGRTSRTGFQRRWRVYGTVWGVAYAIAVTVAATLHGRHTWPMVGASALIMVTTLGSVWREWRR